VEHTQMHPALKTDTKNFHYTSKTCGIFSDLNEIKIPMVDMKVQVILNLGKIKFEKK
jgi:hypothetical protein